MIGVVVNVVVVVVVVVVVFSKCSESVDKERERLCESSGEPSGCC